MNKDIKNLFICESLDKELNIPTHIFECLKDIEGEVDIETKKHLKNALADINLSSLFSKEKYSLNGTKQTILDTSSIHENQGYVIFTKSAVEECNLLNFFSSDFDDVSLSSTFRAIKKMSEALHGVKTRTELQKENGEINNENQLDEISADMLKLGKYVHWQICEELSLRSRSDRSSMSPMITGAVLVKAHLLTDIAQCNGSCGKVYSSANENSDITCECGGEIVLSPPMLKVENVSFVIPEKIEEMIPNPDESSPQNYFNLVHRAFLDRKLLQVLSQLQQYKMGNKITIPSDAFFQYEDTNDIVRVKFIHEVKDDNEVLIFACVTDTRYSDPSFLSSVFLPVILRDIKNGLKGAFNWEDTVARSELRDWVVTPFIKGKELEKIKSFRDLQSLFTGGSNDV